VYFNYIKHFSIFCFRLWGPNDERSPHEAVEQAGELQRVGVGILLLQFNYHSHFIREIYFLCILSIFLCIFCVHCFHVFSNDETSPHEAVEQAGKLQRAGVGTQFLQAKFILFTLLYFLLI
jgi:hypothetical protein